MLLAETLAAVCGVVLLIAAAAVLLLGPRFDISLRSVSALGIGAWGAWLIAPAFSERTVEFMDVLPAAAVALWILHALYRRRGKHMRRATDWAELDGPIQHHRQRGVAQPRLLLGLSLALLPYLLLASPKAWGACVPQHALVPSVLSTGTAVQVVESAAGDRYGWWCPTWSGWEPYTHVVLAGYRRQAGFELRQLLGLANPSAAFTELLKASAVRPATEADAVAFAELHRMARADLATSKPPDPAFTVAKNSIYATRPTRLLLGDSLTEHSQRAPVGEACQCAAAGLLVGSTAWCRFTSSQLVGEAVAVAVCSRVK